MNPLLKIIEENREWFDKLSQNNQTFDRANGQLRKQIQEVILSSQLALLAGIREWVEKNRKHCRKCQDKEWGGGHTLVCDNTTSFISFISQAEEQIKK